MQQTIKILDSKLHEYGNPPYTPKDAEEVKKLQATKQSLLLQLQTQNLPNQQSASAVGTTPTPVPTASIVMQAGTKLTTANIAQMPMINKTSSALVGGSSGISHPHVVISKPAVQQQQPQPMQSYITQQSNAPRDNKLLDKKRLQDLVNEIDPNLQLEDELEEMLMKVLSDFVDEAVSSSCALAQHRKSNILEVKDLKMHLQKQWKIFVPGFSSEDLKTNRKTSSTEAHKQRQALIRKAGKK